MTPCQKTKPTRDPSYLAWIRKQPCVLCGGGPCEAAHQRLLSGGAGSKPDDHHTLPYCNSCHRSEHSRGILTTWNERTYHEFPDKHALRDYLRELCGRIYEMYEKQNKK